MFSEKSCGRSHSYCSGCNPEAVAKAASLRRGNTNGFKVGQSPWNKGTPGPAGELNSFYGKTHSPEARRKMAKRARGRVPWNKGKRGLQVGWSKGLTKATSPSVAQATATRNARLARGEIDFGGRANPSSLTWKLTSFLERAGFENLVVEAQLGPYSVDVLLADEWLAFEADGAYWHRVNDTDYQERDRYLLREHDLPVVRLTEEEITAWQ